MALHPDNKAEYQPPSIPVSAHSSEAAKLETIYLHYFWHLYS